MTEVAQSTAFGGVTADKVEVYCAAPTGCIAFKVCDSAAAQSSCSALQPALAAGGRAVVSRGSSITTNDDVFLADASGAELPGTRVGPFACGPGLSQSRADCAAASFSTCAAPTLGASAGACAPGDFAEPFRASVLFAQNQHGLPEPTCNRPLCQQLLHAIDAAETSIDFAIYGVRAQPDIVNALVSAQGRGVVVRGVVDTINSTGASFGYPETATLVDALGSSHVHADTGPGYSYIMHNKFFVFDHASVWMGSTNISDTELGGEYNSDVAVLLSSPRIAQIYEAEFSEMFGGAFHNRKQDDTEHELPASHFSDGTLVRSYFSPTDHAVANAVVPLIDGAQHTLDIAMFYFTSVPIANAVIAARARGVEVRLVLDASGASNAYSQHPSLCANGVHVKIENWGGKSHSKWAVADAGHTGAAVVFGSMNFTRAGDEQNDENTLYVQNPSFAQAFRAEFERQWADLAAVPRCASVSIEGADSSRCGATNSCHVSCTSGSCCDGVDNDYDGKIDLEEEACACADGVDNDGDGYIDSADFDCRPTPDDP